MEPLTLYAPAKVNLTLTVGDRRPDGYHDVSTVMQAVSLYDTLILTHGGAGLIPAQNRSETFLCFRIFSP